MTPYSINLANLYDELMGDYSQLIFLTKKLVLEFCPKKDHPKLLELGCGTGNVLAAMPKTFSLHGLDNAQGMLDIAKKKVPKAKFYLMDMRSFSIPEKFDSIISPFEPFNHLLLFIHWQQTFQNIADHLDNKGIFVFDVNMPKRHKALDASPAYIRKKDNKFSTIKILHVKKNIYAARFQVFTNLDKKNISLFEEQVFEVSFSLEKIMKALRQYFSVKRIIDPNKAKVTKESGRVVFVCEKK